MNKLLANATVMYTKIHNFHYNVIGSDFHATHVMLEEEYNLFHEWIDEIAETLKMEQETPLGTLAEMLKISTIEEVSAKDYSSKVIYTTLVKDYKELLVNIETEKENASTIRTNMLEDIEAELVKKIWFFEATIK